MTHNGSIPVFDDNGGDYKMGENSNNRDKKKKKKKMMMMAVNASA